MILARVYIRKVMPQQYKLYCWGIYDAVNL